jgi:hypothetical protein
MLVVRHVLKIDILKMEQAFHMGYREGDKVFYLFLTSWKGKNKMFIYTTEHGMNIGLLKMNDLRRCYKKTEIWYTSPTNFFCMLDENH